MRLGWRTVRLLCFFLSFFSSFLWGGVGGGRSYSLPVDCVWGVLAFSPWVFSCRCCFKGGLRLRAFYYKTSLSNAHAMILIVHIFVNVNILCLNQGWVCGCGVFPSVSLCRVYILRAKGTSTSVFAAPHNTDGFSPWPRNALKQQQQRQKQS